MVCAFSLFTHLRHEETYVYLAEAMRVLKPGGRIVFSFLDFRVRSNWDVFHETIQAIGVPRHFNQFMDRAEIDVWAEHLGCSAVAIRNGDDYWVPIAAPITLDDGGTFTGVAPLGQSLAILEKPL